MAGQVIMTMANNIELAEKATATVDAVYAASSKTSVLDDTSGLASSSRGGKAINIPKITMDGLGNHNRNGNYIMGDVTVEYEQKIPEYDRSKLFAVDAMDDEETMGVAFGALAGQFIRTKVVPEQDAYTIARLAEKAGGTASGTFATGDDVVTALGLAFDGMTEKEVPEENRVLFITPSAYGLLRDMDTTKSRAILSMFSNIVQMPSARMKTAIKLLSGVDAEKAGGFEPADGALDINFLIVEKSSVIKFTKHNPIRIGDPDVTNDNYKFSYRIYGITDVFENKEDGVFVHTKPAA